MKKIAFGLFAVLLAGAALATDYGSLPLGQYLVFSVPQGLGAFSDVAEVTTANVSGPLSVVVKGGLHISSGSGRGAGYHTEYNAVSIDSMTVTDSAGNMYISRAV